MAVRNKSSKRNRTRKFLIIIAGLLCGLVGFAFATPFVVALGVSPGEVKDRLEVLGYTQVEVGPREFIGLTAWWHGCSADGVAKFTATAIEPSGISREFYVCVSIDDIYSLVF